MKVVCPQCKTLLNVPEQFPQVRCPKCQSVFAVAAANQAPAAAVKEGGAKIGLIIGIIAGVLVLLIAVGSALLLPAISQARERARRINCAANLKMIGVALRQYSLDCNDRYPDKNVFQILKTNDYLSDDGAFICPSSQKPYVALCQGFREDSAIADMPAVICNGHKGQFINVLYGAGYVSGHLIDPKISGSYESIIKFLIKGLKDDKNVTPYKEMVLRRARELDER
ncbi:MAG: DUF1559 domain-containing protein [Lentisphaeria bacterium]|nr:DUF1559 domain-containing protein [Lentisphaeria bacterium]